MYLVIEQVQGCGLAIPNHKVNVKQQRNCKYLFDVCLEKSQEFCFLVVCSLFLDLICTDTMHKDFTSLLVLKSGYIIQAEFDLTHSR